VVLSGIDRELFGVFNDWVDRLGILDGKVRSLIYKDRTDEVLAELSVMLDPLRAGVP
jgi:hypothetical protein